MFYRLPVHAMPETVANKGLERRTGLEPATCCLEGISLAALLFTPDTT
jgi:hypothetical protein